MDSNRQGMGMTLPPPNPSAPRGRQQTPYHTLQPTYSQQPAPPLTIFQQQPPMQPSARFQQMQAQVDEVVEIMKNKVDKLTQLDHRADALQEGAARFERSAATLRRKYWWKNVKLVAAIILVVLILLVIVLLWTGAD